MEPKLGNIFGFRILRIERGDSVVKLYFFEEVPYTKEYILEDKLSPDYSRATVKLFRMQIDFKAPTDVRAVADKIRAEFPSAGIGEPPIKASIGDFDLLLDSDGDGGATLSKTNRKIVEDRRERIASKVKSIRDTITRGKEKKRGQSMDF